MTQFNQILILEFKSDDGDKIIHIGDTQLIQAANNYENVDSKCDEISDIQNTLKTFTQMNCLFGTLNFGYC